MASDDVLKRYSAQPTLAENDNLRSLDKLRSVAKLLGDIAGQSAANSVQGLCNQDWQASKVEVHKGDICSVKVEGTWVTGKSLDTERN